jgi:hypothetical protein
MKEAVIHFSTTGPAIGGPYFVLTSGIVHTMDSAVPLRKHHMNTF